MPAAVLVYGVCPADSFAAVETEQARKALFIYPAVGVHW